AAPGQFNSPFRPSPPAPSDPAPRQGDSSPSCCDGEGQEHFVHFQDDKKPDKKPNILVIWGDDIGTWNISHNSRGMMGYKTPNIDRIAREGISFTDYYGQQSCTAGRAAFIGGNVPVRTGMTKVGLPGAKEGWQESDPTM